MMTFLEKALGFDPKSMSYALKLLLEQQHS